MSLLNKGLTRAVASIETENKLREENINLKIENYKLKNTIRDLEIDNITLRLESLPLQNEKPVEYTTSSGT